MNFDDFKRTTGAGGEALARQAWDKAVELIKAALPNQAAAIDAALEAEPEPVVVAKTATDSGDAAEGTK